METGLADMLAETWKSFGVEVDLTEAADHQIRDFQVIVPVAAGARGAP